MMSINHQKGFHQILDQLVRKLAHQALMQSFALWCLHLEPCKFVMVLLFVFFIVYPIANAGDWQIKSLHERC